MEQASLRGYCVQCREEREMTDAEEVLLPAAQGEGKGMKGSCATCGAGMFVLGEPTRSEV